MSEHAHKQLIAVLQPQGQFELDWQTIEQPIEANALKVQDEIYDRFSSREPDFFFWLAFATKTDGLAESVNYLAVIASAFLKALAHLPNLESLRERADAELGEEQRGQWLASAPFMLGMEHLDEGWLESAWRSLHDAYAWKVQRSEGTVAQLLMASDPSIQLAGRVYFHLVENKPSEELPFSFMATYAAEGEQSGKPRHLPLKNALIEYGDNQAKLLELLATVQKASLGSSFIADLVDTGDIFHPIGLMADEAYTFLREVSLYEDAGILCRIPKWWTAKSTAVKVSVNIGEKPPSHLGADALLNFDARLWLGGESISEEEIRMLLSEAEGLVFLKGKWVEVNHKRLQAALLAYENAQMKIGGSQQLTISEAMRLQLHAGQSADGIEESVQIEITNGDWLVSLKDKLLNPDKLELIATEGEDFHANLRGYQERGLSWLYHLKTMGLGACLADDMGLGKTVQVIALLNHIRTRKQERALLVVPASLIGNWMGEIKKFAPSLRYCVWHPSENKAMGASEAETDVLHNYELVITTYGMLLKYGWLTDTVWDTLILDEAQAIKNPGTKQTKQVKKIKANAKIAMTGTPIENRLSDLWSLFDFLNKGLLGTAKEFTTFTKSMRERPDGYQRLKQAVSPFILRRLKTDKTIITDLPDKIEMKSYAALSKKQAVLYSKLVADLQKKLESVDEGIERKGLVLSSLMKFKQICNHPDQYLGQQVFAEGDSGKLAKLREICETIMEKRERVLVFTQFKELTEPLRAFLEQIFNHKGLVLHGGTAVTKRKDIVAEFQGAHYVPFMVLSIKAGGVGLNLTKANHVIHFDRWWNPAVENQATDRAFRIGQEKNVIVHKFITQGTIEEKIDEIIEGKSKLSNEIVPDMQENWITEMDNAQLIELMKLTS
ncbi:DEAD/DEAH box helicase [Paenibacillaceae bacterium]|nr:DEAD/DEAH box helicase [Paenibacillaceae bacterium]